MADNKRFQIISKLNKTDIIKLFENLSVDELKHLVILENKDELISLIENIYTKSQLQDILYRTTIDVSKFEPRRKLPIKPSTEIIKSENDKLHEEMMKQRELKLKIKTLA